MAYKVKKGFEAQKIGAKIFDGTKVFNGTLGDATQEELEELHLIGIKNIIKEKKTKRKSKKRDNAPSEPLPLPPKED
jgi:hypothetical protein